jgi:cellobiose phosphorylase
VKEANSSWRFTDEEGSFEWVNPDTWNELYFPICNEAGLMASVTPELHGDCTTGQHSFVRLPLVVRDLYNTRSARNFWIYNDDLSAYSLTGNSARQRSALFTGNDRVEVRITAAPLAFTLRRADPDAGIESTITIYSPIAEDKVEILLVKITNISPREVSFVPTSGFPLYARSADNLRDHNHWTSMSHRMSLSDYGLSVKPAMQHDERGHRKNRTSYFVVAAGSSGEKPEGQFPTVAEFIGEGGSFDWPRAVVENKSPYAIPPNRRDGMESIGAIRFAKARLGSGCSIEYVVIEGATEDESSIERCLERYGNSSKARAALDASLAYWKERSERIVFKTEDGHFNNWMRWVAIQPTLRKIYGNSFLPHFDYGRGGRGWRDLWQDCLALLLQSPDEMRATLVANFAGVRLDGSNATIIEKGLGEFAADRNRISRVWMDHGAWPLFAVKLYIDQTGDLDILFRSQSYWKDHQIRRAKSVDGSWDPSAGNLQRSARGDAYSGSIFEHLLVQHLTCFHNVGEHNIIRLEDGDWNDLLDMAGERGESVPFTAFYGSNLLILAELLRAYRSRSGADEIELLEDLASLTRLEEGLDYDSVVEKRKRLDSYYDRIGKAFRGGKARFPIRGLIEDLEGKGRWLLERVRSAEWIESKTGYGFFNGYYDDDGARVDGDDSDGPRMNLTAQTFAIISGAASPDQVARSFRAASCLLRDPRTGGFRLTSPLGGHTWNFGRGFAVVYGEKETGGAFNHMAVMFMNALYRRGFVKEGYAVFRSVYELANDIEKARIFPGIPEYINHEGIGKYHYLTGSASWLLMTLLVEMYGVRGRYGDLLLEPKLLLEQFDREGEAKVSTSFLGRRIDLRYVNRSRLEYPRYRIVYVGLNGESLQIEGPYGSSVLLDRTTLARALGEGVNRLDVELGE